MAKLILDALNKAVWADDHQIDELILWRGRDEENPRSEILVYTLE
jgi:Holliday junction resolvase RusA-like endonuclease